MASATLNNDKIELTTLFREKALVDKVPGARWNNGKQCWMLPNTYTVLYQLSQVFGPALSLSEDLQEDLTIGSSLRDIATDMRTLSDQPLEGYFREADLTPLQRVGANYLIYKGNVALTDEQGSGKTVQTCAAIQALVDLNPNAKILVVCPGAVVPSWAGHILQWTSAQPFIFRGSQKERKTAFEEFQNHPGAAVLITTWELTWRHSKLKSPGSVRLTDKEKEPKELNSLVWDLVVCDEAHRMANPKAKQTMAVFALHAHQRVALTGTPIANHPGDFWSILHFLDPNEWPSRARYVDRYCATSWNPFGGVDIVGIKPRLMEEFHHLTDYYVIRRLQYEVIGRKIPIVREERCVQLTPKHRKLYNQLRRESMIELPDGNILTATNPLELLTRAMQLSAAMLTMDIDGKVRMANPSPVVDELMTLVEELDEPIVVFSASKQLLHIAEERLRKENVSLVVVTGDTPANLRQIAIDDFQEGKVKVFLATMGTAGEGITLTAAKTLVYLQRSWSMVKNLQAQDRIRRWGQEASSVTVIDIITEDTCTERLFSAFSTKMGRLDEITMDSVKEII